MRKLLLAAALPAALVAVPAVAQDASYPASTTTDPAAQQAPAPADAGTPEAPDGSRAFGIEPYFGVLGGWEQFDAEPNSAGIPTSIPGRNFRNNKLNGSLVQGVVGVNVPLGPVFVGAEGEVAKGISGDIDWQYGAAGRFGLRAGESGLIYGKVGYRWVNFSRFGDDSRDYDDITYGVGFEVGPKTIGLGGITGESGIRIRGEVSTFGDAHSFRPMLGLVTHF